ncbi:TPA: CusA/CzcA family heavy metal efflux RND transporter [Candidatus Poribacteria bacterium]|nr:CusA/CzcA family heavy metal efflux RND transporter [Candidatus Poribacteria bacterium]
MWSKIIEFSLKYKLLVIVVAIAVTILGWQTFQSAPIDVYPDINPPRITVLTEAHGWSPEEMETLVTLPIESTMNGIPYVDRVRSSSAIGLSLVFVEFAWGTDIFLARQMVSERLQLIASNLPSGVDAPIILPTSSLLGEIIEYALVDETGQFGPMEMRDLADWIIRYQLQSQGGIAKVINIGGYIKQYQVFINPDQLTSFDLSLEDVALALESSNENSAGGFLIRDAQELMIRGLGRIETVADIEDVVIDTRQHGRPILVKDVARVQIGSTPEIRRGAGSRNGTETVLGKVVKQPGVNTLALTDKVLSVLSSLEASLPDGIKIKREYVQADLIRRAVDTVKEALRDGAILVTVVLAVFLFNFRTALIALTAIPLSLVISVIVLIWQGFSINVMTLSGLAIAVGMVVDDAIVNVENIFRRLREYFQQPTSETSTQVVLRASNEIRSSIVFATLIIILVFIPLFSLDGMEGRMFRPLGWAVAISMIVSLLVALTLIPALSDCLLTANIQFPGKESPIVNWIKKGYRPLLVLTLKWRIWVLGAAFILMLLTLSLIPRLGREFLPVMDEATFTVSVFSPPGTSLGESVRIGREMEVKLLTIPEVISVSSRTGRADADEHAHDVNTHEIVVNFTPPDKREKSREELLESVRQLLSSQNFPGIMVSVGQPIQHRLDHLLSGVNAQVAIKLFGPDLNQLRQKAEQIHRVMLDVDGVTDLQVEQQVQVEQLQIKVDRLAAARYGLSVKDVNHFVESAFKGEVISQILQGQRQYDMVMRVDPSFVNQINKIAKLKIRASGGHLVPLEQVAEVQTDYGPNTINRENVSRRIVIQCNVQKRDLASFVTEVQTQIQRRVSLTDGYFVTYGGQFESQQAAQKRILIQTGGVLVGIFILLYLAMNSVRLSLLVMLNLPLALIGGIISVFFSSGILSIPSMVGFILLFGIAVRNGIILTSHINDLRSEGLPLYEAILKGAEERISPVLMTALTTGLGMLPLALADGSGAELQKPLAIVISGGMVTATMLTLLVLPMLYYMVESNGDSERAEQR